MSQSEAPQTAATRSSQTIPYCRFLQGVTTPIPTATPTQIPTRRPTNTPSEQPSKFLTTFYLGTASFVSTGNTYDPDVLLDFLQDYLGEGYFFVFDFKNELDVQLLSVSQPNPVGEDGTSQVTTYEFNLLVPISDLLSFLDGEDYTDFINKVTQDVIDFFDAEIEIELYLNDIFFISGAEDETFVTAIIVIPATLPPAVAPQ